MSSTAQRLKDQGITLPEAAQPVANYVSYVKTGQRILVSGQLPRLNGTLDGQTGVIGQTLTTEDGQRIAKQCAINILSQISHACSGNLDNVRCLRLSVFIRAIPDFTEHSVVANGASDLMVAILGENGKHARSAVGVASLPFGAAVEIDGIFEKI